MKQTDKRGAAQSIKADSAPTYITRDSGVYSLTRKDKVGPILLQLCWSKDRSKARLQGEAPSFIRPAVWSSASCVSDTKKSSQGVDMQYSCSLLNHYVNPVRQFERKGG